MQIIPPSVKPPAKYTKPKSGQVSRRRLFSLITTAAIASSLGIALGSTLRFKIVPVSQAPLFKPQQDFPPLAEWPPKAPLITEHDEFDTYWEDEVSSPQLVYNDRSDTEVEEVESYNDSEYVYDEEEEYVPEENLTPEELSSPVPTNISDKDDTISEEVFEEETLPPVISNTTGELNNESDSLNPPPQIDNANPITDTPIWFDKQPLSESQFTNGPVIVSPDDLDPLSGLRSD